MNGISIRFFWEPGHADIQETRNLLNWLVRLLQLVPISITYVHLDVLSVSKERQPVSGPDTLTCQDLVYTRQSALQGTDR